MTGNVRRRLAGAGGEFGGWLIKFLRTNCQGFLLSIITSKQHRITQKKYIPSPRDIILNQYHSITREQFSHAQLSHDPTVTIMSMSLRTACYISMQSVIVSFLLPSWTTLVVCSL